MPDIFDEPVVPRDIFDEPPGKRDIFDEPPVYTYQGQPLAANIRTPWPTSPNETPQPRTAQMGINPEPVYAHLLDTGPTGEPRWREMAKAEGEGKSIHQRHAILDQWQARAMGAITAQTLPMLTPGDTEQESPSILKPHLGREALNAAGHGMVKAGVSMVPAVADTSFGGIPGRLFPNIKQGAADLGRRVDEQYAAQYPYDPRAVANQAAEGAGALATNYGLSGGSPQAFVGISGAQGYGNARQAGASEGAAAGVGAIQAGAATLRFPGMEAAGKAAGTSIAKNIAINVPIQGGIGTISSLGENAIARHTYDPNRPLSQGVQEAWGPSAWPGMVAFGVGSALHAHSMTNAPAQTPSPVPSRAEPASPPSPKPSRGRMTWTDEGGQHHEGNVIGRGDNGNIAIRDDEGNMHQVPVYSLVRPGNPPMPTEAPSTLNAATETNVQPKEVPSAVNTGNATQSLPQADLKKDSRVRWTDDQGQTHTGTLRTDLMAGDAVGAVHDDVGPRGATFFISRDKLADINQPGETNAQRVQKTAQPDGDGGGGEVQGTPEGRPGVPVGGQTEVPAQVQAKEEATPAAPEPAKSDAPVAYNPGPLPEISYHQRQHGIGNTINTLEGRIQEIESSRRISENSTSGQRLRDLATKLRQQLNEALAKIPPEGHDFDFNRDLPRQASIEEAAPELPTQKGFQKTKAEFANGNASMEQMHRSMVQGAINRGDGVPSDVMADYPDLKRQAPAENPLSGKGKAFSKADVERRLLSHHEEMSGEGKELDERSIAESAAGDAFMFPGHLPDEVNRMLDGNPQLKPLVRVARTEGEKANATGPDALAEFGEDKWLEMLERRAGGSINDALETARRSQDPEMQLLAAIHENWPVGEKTPDKTIVAGSDIATGKEFEINGHKFRVVEGPDGHRLMKDGEEYPELPIDYLGRIPVDKGTLKNPAMRSIFENRQPRPPGPHERSGKIAIPTLAELKQAVKSAKNAVSRIVAEIDVRGRLTRIWKRFGPDIAQPLTRRANARNIASEGESYLWNHVFKGSPAPEQSYREWRDLGWHSRGEQIRQQGGNPTGVPNLTAAEVARRMADPTTKKAIDVWNREFEPEIDLIRQANGLHRNLQSAGLPFILNLPTETGPFTSHVGPIPFNRRFNRRASGAGHYVDDPAQTVSRILYGHAITDSSGQIAAQVKSMHRELVTGNGGGVTGFKALRDAQENGTPVEFRGSKVKLGVVDLNFGKYDAAGKPLRQDYRYIPKDIAHQINNIRQERGNWDTIYDKAMGAVTSVALVGGAAPMHANRLAHAVGQRIAANGNSVTEAMPSWLGSVPMAFKRMGQMAGDTPLGRAMRSGLVKMGADRGTGWGLAKNQGKWWNKAHDFLFDPTTGMDPKARAVLLDAELETRLGDKWRATRTELEAGRISADEATRWYLNKLGNEGQMQVGQQINNLLGWLNPQTRGEALNHLNRAIPFIGSESGTIPSEIKRTLLRNIQIDPLLANLKRGDYKRAALGFAAMLGTGSIGVYLLKNALNAASTKMTGGEAKSMSQNDERHKNDVALGGGWFLNQLIDPGTTRGERLLGMREQRNTKPETIGKEIQRTAIGAPHPKAWEWVNEGLSTLSPALRDAFEGATGKTLHFDDNGKLMEHKGGILATLGEATPARETARALAGGKPVGEGILKDIGSLAGLGLSKSSGRNYSDAERQAHEIMAKDRMARDRTPEERARREAHETLIQKLRDSSGNPGEVIRAAIKAGTIAREQAYEVQREAKRSDLENMTKLHMGWEESAKVLKNPKISDQEKALIEPIVRDHILAAKKPDDWKDAKLKELGIAPPADLAMKRLQRDRGSRAKSAMKRHLKRGEELPP